MRSGACARARIGQLATALPASATNSRRLIGFSPKLLDHLIGAQEERLGDRDSDRLGGNQVYDKAESSWLFDRDIGWLRSAQNFVDELGGAPPEVREVWPVGHQTTRFDEIPAAVHRRQSRRAR